MNMDAYETTRKGKDNALKKLVENSYKSTHIVGRGTVLISPKEVRESEGFKQALVLAKEIVTGDIND